jgi:hypothetical protein
MLGSPTISDDNEFGIPKVPIYITFRDGLIAGGAALMVGLVCVYYDYTLIGLLALIGIFTGTSMVCMKLRESYGQAWVFNLLMRLGFTSDSLGLLGTSNGRIRALGPVARPARTRFRGGRRDLGQVTQADTYFAPLGFCPSVPRCGCDLRMTPMGIGGRLAEGRAATIVTGAYA